MNEKISYNTFSGFMGWRLPEFDFQYIEPIVFNTDNIGGGGGADQQLNQLLADNLAQAQQQIQLLQTQQLIGGVGSGAGTSMASLAGSFGGSSTSIASSASVPQSPNTTDEWLWDTTLKGGVGDWVANPNFIPPAQAPVLPVSPNPAVAPAPAPAPAQVQPVLTTVAGLGFQPPAPTGSRPKGRRGGSRPRGRLNPLLIQQVGSAIGGVPKIATAPKRTAPRRPRTSSLVRRQASQLGQTITPIGGGGGSGGITPLNL